ncbi:MAG: hypothetical protein U0234_25555 [Sandaracinus sp.]
MIGAAQLPCESFVLAIVAEDLEPGEGDPVFVSQLLLVSEGFVVRARSRVTRREANELGRDVAALVAGKTKELSFQTESGHLYLSLTPAKASRSGALLHITGHVVQAGTGVLSAFESRTDRSMLQSFGDDLRVFPYAG